MLLIALNQSLNESLTQCTSVGPFPDRAGDSLIIKTNWSPE